MAALRTTEEKEKEKKRDYFRIRNAIHRAAAPLSNDYPII